MSKESTVILGNHIVFTEKFFLNYENGSNFVIITDETVKSLWGEKLMEAFHKRGFEAFMLAFDPGERSKNLGVYAKIVNAMGNCNVGKNTHVIGFGGGVVTDMAGFVAATFHRGMPLTLVPTTLMGVIDASIGGKNAVNSNSAKNQVGTFYPPKILIADCSFLTTLPLQEWYHGASELLKLALIQNVELFRFLEDEPLFWVGQESLVKAIQTGVQGKIDICQQDLKEELGLRTLLNFGHTIGHALEHLSGYTMPHGEAVAKGLYWESMLSGLDETSLSRIETILEAWGYDISLPALAADKWKDALRHDKKGGFVRLEEIGKAKKGVSPICNEDLCKLEEAAFVAK
ncbi:MAG: 3-dehydroquinate synthase [Chlamydiales bacterium]